MERVVITGVGLISPFGMGLEPFRKGVRNGVCCPAAITRFDVRSLRSKKGGLVSDFDPRTFDPDPRFTRLPRVFQYALVAAEGALRDAALELAQEDRGRLGVFFGTEYGAGLATDTFHANLIERGPTKVNPLLFQYSTYAVGPGLISIKYGLQGPSVVVASGFSHGLGALDLATFYLRQGRIEGAFAVAADELASVYYEALVHLGVLSPQDGGEEVGRPFDKRRNGPVLAEGACALWLETYRHAQSRGARIYAEVAGVGTAHDAYKAADYDPQGRGLETAMRLALQESGMKEVDYIAAAAPGGQVLDAAETQAIKRIWGPQAAQIPVSSVKSMLGEAMSTGGLFNVVAGLVAVQDSFLPPTIHYGHPDPACDLDCVPNVAREAEVRVALANACSFGGSSSSVVLRKG